MITPERREYLKQFAQQRAPDFRGQLVCAVLDATQATIPDLALMAAADERVGRILYELLMRSFEAAEEVASC